MNNKYAKWVLYFAFFQAFVATVGSMFLSLIMKLPPCNLCWYQRIAMFPIGVILFIGILRKDKFVHFYALPFSIAGLLIATYHLLLQEGIISEQLLPCAAGISCSVKYAVLFDFITIPLMSLTAFIVITVSLVVYHKLLNKKNG